MPKNILILQHIPIETPGFILDLMIKDNINLTTIELDQGEKIPKDLTKFDAMFCMGGPMDTWMEEDYPWLIDEKNKIKDFVVNLEKPFLGFCLGCQLLGEVVGGNVVKSSPPEIGILDINLLETKNSDSIFCDFPFLIKALQWHSYEVQGLENNKNITIIGSSTSTKYQIFKYKNHAYGIQFHIEIKDNTVADWGCVPEYKLALEDSLGANALNTFDNLAKENMTQMNLLASKLYKNFITLT
jgi:GMP synthase-like glutamine amidotransferase